MSLPFMQPYMGLGNSLQTAQASVGGGGIGGWVELGRTTLGGAASTITVSSITDKRYYMILNSSLGTVANADIYGEFNSDTGSNYSNRFAYNGTEGTQASTSRNSVHITAASSNTPFFAVGNYANLSAKEKLGICNSVQQMTAGAGTAPQRSENATKWANTAAVINAYTLMNSGASNYATGSEVVVLGWDPADTHTSNFWEELASVTTTGSGAVNSGTFTAKKYLWIQFFGLSSSSHNVAITFNGDSGANYSRRYTLNGAGDSTSVSNTSTLPAVSMGNESFTNMFIINNSANEKLMISHSVGQLTAGAGTAPNRCEAVGKWANTSSQITSINFEVSGGTFIAGSIIKVWGSD